MAEHGVNGLMAETMEKIRSMVDVNTIIGDPIVTHDGTTLIPISKVTFGFGSVTMRRCALAAAVVLASAFSRLRSSSSARATRAFFRSICRRTAARIA